MRPRQVTPLKPVTDFSQSGHFRLFGVRFAKAQQFGMKHILIIDDHTDIRENIAEILTLGGYQTTTAENGKKGVELALQLKPDLVVCDIMMPELDGYGVLHLLRKNPDTEHIPFIFLTAKVERSDFRRGMEMGADDFITKPFDDIELLNAIEVRLRKQDVLHQKYNGGEEGVKEFMHNLQESGMIKLDPNDYETVQFSKRQMVYSEGKRPKFLYYVRAGKVKTFRLNEDGKEYITNLYSAGDYFGYIPLLENTAYEDNAEVLEDADLALIGREDFVQAVFNDMTIAGKFIRLISQNVKEKEDRLLHLAYDSLRKRVAKALVDIHQKFNGNENSSALDIPREDIAQYVGTATESLIRTLSDFKSEKLIEIKEGKIRITDLARLSNLLY